MICVSRTLTHVRVTNLSSAENKQAAEISRKLLHDVKVGGADAAAAVKDDDDVSDCAAARAQRWQRDTAPVARTVVAARAGRN